MTSEKGGNTLIAAASDSLSVSILLVRTPCLACYHVTHGTEFKQYGTQ